MIYIQLFLSFLQVGALSFGGGYAAMPLIQEQVVNLHSWLSMSEFTNLITIAEMTPYFATRSDLDGAPVLIWQVLRATARSAIVVSAVSPERWEEIAV